GTRSQPCWTSQGPAFAGAWICARSSHPAVLSRNRPRCATWVGIYRSTPPLPTRSARAPRAPAQDRPRRLVTHLALGDPCKAVNKGRDDAGVTANRIGKQERGLE